MIAEKKIIKNLTVEIDTNSMAIALQLKDKINSFLEQKIYPILENHFDKIDNKNETIILENMSLEFHLTQGVELEEIIPEIKSQLHKKVALKEDQKSKEKVEILEIKSTYQRKKEAFFFFLKEGYYPWWFNKNEIFTPEDVKGIKKEEIKRIINSIKCLNRLIYQLDYKVINEIINTWYHSYEKERNLFGNIPSFLKNKERDSDFINAIFRYKLNANKIEFQQSFWKHIIAITRSKFDKTENSISIENKDLKYVFKTLKYCSDILSIPIQLISVKNLKNTYQISFESNSNFAIKNDKEIEEILSSKSNINLIKKEEENLSKITSKSEEKSVQKISAISKENADKFSPKKEIFNDEILKDGMLINNAGLILIHPFLKHFFENLGFLFNGNIKDNKIDEAVHILHYLACGTLQPQEQFLQFEKYLCNIPLKYPIKRFVTLTDKQKDACEELLKAVLGHWKGLKSENTAILQNEFLSREGKLTISGERDSIYIQRKTQDILLDSLPWNVHLVKLPWKKKIIFIEW